ncbi:hypothetical protein AWZ03_014437 [Drosophila navojoa]|uniref:Uncharacterized protein n=1 Tax=Drosophila navojoa TaxID=7232 RepID=A0A484AU57_DRONA|nr:hypothetical protein AWZ03_014437 [Drosophila navojoa]
MVHNVFISSVCLDNRKLFVYLTERNTRHSLYPSSNCRSLSQYYEFSKDQDYICSTPEDSGMHLCGNFPPYRIGSLVCTEEAKLLDLNEPTNTSCVNWNQYYTTCKQSGENPFQGTISFDNIGMAWVAIFLQQQQQTRQQQQQQQLSNLHRALAAAAAAAAAS